MKNVFEKRLDFNFNRYKKMPFEELIAYEKKLYENVYKDFSDSEIISAELEIITEDLENEIHNKQIDSNSLIYYRDYLKKLNKIKNYCELNDYKYDDLKKIITIIQLSLNIKPSFITSLDMNKSIDLYDYLDEYCENKILTKKG